MVATSGDVVPLVLRLTLAGVMFAHGAQKALGWFGGFEYHVLAIGLAVALVLSGAGVWSLDAMIAGH